MKSFFCSISMLLCITGISQDLPEYSAILLNLNGKGLYYRGSNGYNLDIPQSYIAGDMIKMAQGNALVMLFNGEEIALQEGSEIQIPHETKLKNTEVKNLTKKIKLNHSLLAQSGVAYSLRGEYNSFPMKSRFLNPDEVFLKFKLEESANLSFKIIDSQTQKVIYKADSITDSVMYLSKVPFVQGRSYYWSISGFPQNKPCIGVLEYPSQQELEQIKEFDSPQSNLDYIAAIEYYHENGYYFKAYSLIQKAMRDNPNIGIYPIMLKNLLSSK